MSTKILIVGGTSSKLLAFALREKFEVVLCIDEDTKKTLDDELLYSQQP